MLRLLITPRWLVRHVLLVLVLVSFGLLGWWQWEAGRSERGGLQNYGYAIEWWVFAGFAAFMWVRELLDELKPEGVAPEPRAPGDDYVRPEPVLYEDDEDDESDDELNAYNEYLARLNRPARRP